MASPSSHRRSRELNSPRRPPLSRRHDMFIPRESNPSVAGCTFFAEQRPAVAPVPSMRQAAGLDSPSLGDALAPTINRLQDAFSQARDYVSISLHPFRRRQSRRDAVVDFDIRTAIPPGGRVAFGCAARRLDVKQFYVYLTFGWAGRFPDPPERPLAPAPSDPPRPAPPRPDRRTSASR